MEMVAFVLEKKNLTISQFAFDSVELALADKAGNVFSIFKRNLFIKGCAE